MTNRPQAVLEFWFGRPDTATGISVRQGHLWFGKSQANDRAVSEQFSATLSAAAAGQLDHWADTPSGRLALIIVLDQFPHHVHRDTPLAFATDARALALTREALAAREDTQLTPIERVFLYLPLEHAESNDMQALSVSLYEQLLAEVPENERGLFADFLKYARSHRDVVARFGRFPHRNAILGRPSTPDEIEFLQQPGSRF